MREAFLMRCDAEMGGEFGGGVFCRQNSEMVLGRFLGNIVLD